jgi:hypothetical protein
MVRPMPPFYKAQGVEVGAVLTPVLKSKQDRGGRVHKHGNNTIAFWYSETPASWAYLPYDTSYSFPSLCRYSGLPTLGYPRDTSCNHTTSGSIGPLAERGFVRGYVREGLREVGGGFEGWRAGNLRGEASLLKALLVPAGAGLLSWEVDVRYSEELQSILSRFGVGPAPKDQVVQYLTRQSSETTEQDAGGVLADLEDEGYVEMVLGEKGELVRFTERAIDEVFG